MILFEMDDVVNSLLCTALFCKELLQEMKKESEKERSEASSKRINNEVLQQMKKESEKERSEASYKRINFLFSRISDAECKFYQCMLCDFKSESGKEIKIHFLRHSNAKNFKCTLCNFSTYQKAEFESHQKTHKLPDFNLKDVLAHLKQRDTTV